MKKTSTFLAALCLSASFMATAQTHTPRVTVTLAGDGFAGFSGDGALSKFAKIAGPKDVCVDLQNNLYFVDLINRRIRRIDAQTGIITTIAGGGSSTADGVPALSAQLDASTSYMCVNPAGDIFICTENKIKKISAAGIISTFAGTGAAGYTGDMGPATAATFNNLQGVALDAAGNLYVVDRNNARIRKINAATNIVTTIAGAGVPGYSGDMGAASVAQLSYPACIAVTSIGDIYFADQNPGFPATYCDSKIRKITAATGIITTVAGQTPGSYTFDYPANSCRIGTTTGICCDDGDTIITNEWSCSCRSLHSDSLFIVGGNFAIQGYSDAMASEFSNMNMPMGLCVDHAGSVYIADSANNRIRKIIKLSHTPTFTYGEGLFVQAHAGTAFSLDSLLWITDLDSGQVETWSVASAPSHGTLTGFPGTTTSVGITGVVARASLKYTPASTFTGNDVFKVRVSDGTLSDTITVYAAVTGGVINTVNDLSAKQLTVFPNPATTQLFIEGTVANADVVIRSVTGAACYTGVANAQGSASIDISMLPAGVYFVRVNEVAKSFIKE